jgi:hypothetical protein
MLARAPCPDIKNYASKRVFDGTRPLGKARVAKLRANYNRTQTTTVYRLVVQPAKRVWRLLAAR